MLNKLLMSSLAATAMVGSALSADLPFRNASPVSYAPPIPIFTWTGFYIGVNAGYTFGSSSGVTTKASNYLAEENFESEGALSAALASGAIPTKANTFIGGGQIGYNWQIASLVTGIEADIQGVAGKGSGKTFGLSPVPGFPDETMFSANSARKKLTYLGTVRGRLGFLVTPSLLAYATGGLAYGGVSHGAQIFQGVFLTPAEDCDFCAPYAAAGGFSSTRIGYTLGGGAEWMFLPNWSAKVEYMYYNLGRGRYEMSALANTFTDDDDLVWASHARYSTRFDGHIVRVGLNYHFNSGASAPVFAR